MLQLERQDLAILSLNCFPLGERDSDGLNDWIVIMHRDDAAKVSRNSEPAGARPSIELASIDRSIEDCYSRVLDDPARCHSQAISATARRMSATPIHQLFRFMPEKELETYLSDILVRLRGVGRNLSTKGPKPA